MRIKGRYSLFLPMFIVTIGAANRKIFKKEKCHTRFAAPCLLG
jgi:hypothetical protein